MWNSKTCRISGHQIQREGSGQEVDFELGLTDGTPSAGKENERSHSRMAHDPGCSLDL